MKKIKLYGVAMLIASIGISCKKFVEIGAPKTQLVTSNVFAHNETATAALTTIYAEMSDNEEYRLPLYMGLAGDEFTNYQSGASFELYTNSNNASQNSLPNGIWTSAYNYIFQANAVYEGCQQSTTLDPDVKKQLIAEALFIRAYWDFYLVNLYGSVPLITSTDYRINAVAARAPADKLYVQIIADLKSAQADLNENYVGADGTSTSEKRVRPNKSVATALLARVYLYTKDYHNAELEATSIISNTSYSLTPLDEVFLKNSKETIWQLLPSNNSSFNTQEGHGFILTGAPLFTGQFSLSAQILNAFEGGDLRKIQWVGKFTDVNATPNVDYYYPFKYKVQAGSSYTEYSMVLRLAEQFLIRAESRNEQNNTFGALEDLNIIRTRARAVPTVLEPTPLPNLTTSLSQGEIRTAILKERMVELFSEQGHRWLDLKRTKSIDSVMDIVSPLKGGTWASYKQLWPISPTVLLNDPNIKQNLGYTY